MLNFILKIISFIFAVFIYVIMICVYLVKLIFDLLVYLFTGAGKLLGLGVEKPLDSADVKPLGAIGNLWNDIIGFLKSAVVDNLRELSDKHFKDLLFLFDSSYYQVLWNKYFNVLGFIIGAIVMFFVYFAGCDISDPYKDEKSISDTMKKFLNSIVTITLINSTLSIYTLLGGNLEFYSANNVFPLILMDRAVNPIASIFIIIIISSKRFNKRDSDSDSNIAFTCFGWIVYGITLAFYMDKLFIYGTDLGMFFILRAFTLGCICLIVSNFSNISTRLFVFIPYYFIMKIIQFKLVEYDTFGNVFKNISINYIFDSTKFLYVDLIMFVVIAVALLMYEKISKTA